jgi:hypothetical protein
VAKLRPNEIEQVIKLVGRCPSCYPVERSHCVCGEQLGYSILVRQESHAANPKQPYHEKIEFDGWPTSFRLEPFGSIRGKLPMNGE